MLQQHGNHVNLALGIVLIPTHLGMCWDVALDDDIWRWGRSPSGHAASRLLALRVAAAPTTA